MIDQLFADARAAGASGLTAWPDGPGRAALRLMLPEGSVAGRWHADTEEAGSAAEPGAQVLGRIVLHRNGVDRRLPAVAAAVAAGEQLVAHRVGRRAVLRTPTGFRKLVRASRLAGLRTAVDRTRGLPLPTPQVIDQDDTSITLSPLPGLALHDLIRTGAATTGQLRRVGRVLADLHAAPVPVGLPRHDTAAEIAVTARWTDLAALWGAGATENPVPPVPTPPARPVLLHRDLHDKQILVDGADGIGILDFDLAAAGDPALDLANLIEHLWLRRRQGAPLDAEAGSAALLDGYRPDDRTRAALSFHRCLTRRRLAAVYAFRTSRPG